MTDEPGAFRDGETCVVYRAPEELPGIVEDLLAHEDVRSRIAEAGQRETLNLHTYDVRAEALDAELRGILAER